jgi:hypothetical protein
MIHIHEHEINQGRRILELNQHILCYSVGMHHNGVCQLQLMRGRDQWFLIQAVIDHLGQDVHTSSPITERMMDLEWHQVARNCGECWSAKPILKLVEDSIAANPIHQHSIPVGWLG